MLHVNLVREVPEALKPRRVEIQSGQAIEATALADENVRRFTEGKAIRRAILVPGKLVNIVL